jgi:hypothetical protein
MASMELALAALCSVEAREKLNISLVTRTYSVSQSALSKHFWGIIGSKEDHYNN